MKSTSLASQLSGYSVDGKKRFVKDLSRFKSASVDRPLDKFRLKAKITNFFRFQLIFVKYIDRRIFMAF